MNKIRTEFDKPLRYKKSHWSSDGAAFYILSRKTPIAWGTVAEMETLISLDRELGGLLNIAEEFNKGNLILSSGERDIIEVKLSYGEERMG